jgi:predicted phosphodiesterase
MNRPTALILGLLLTCTILLVVGTSLSAYSWKWAAVGDIVCKDAAKLAKAIKVNTDPEVVLLLGDLGYGKSSDCIKKAFIDNGIQVATPGNHDKTKNILKVFKLKSGTYLVTHKNVAFISFNTEDKVSNVKKEIQPLISKADSNSSIDFTVPFSHKPLVTSDGAHHGEEKKFRSALVPLFVQSDKVKLVDAGHNHGYQQCESDGIVFLTVGTGGRKAYAWGSGTDDNCHNNISGVPGYLEVDVDSNSSMVGVFKDLKGGINEEITFQITR